jgi:hypothetical protein
MKVSFFLLICLINSGYPSLINLQIRVLIKKKSNRVSSGNLDGHKLLTLIEHHKILPENQMSDQLHESLVHPVGSIFQLCRQRDMKFMKGSNIKILYLSPRKNMDPINLLRDNHSIFDTKFALFGNLYILLSVTKPHG